MKLIKLAAVALAVTGMALADSNDRLVVKVPFSFEVGGRQLPAGAYTISEMNPNGVVYVRGQGTSILALSGPAGDDTKGQSALVFERVNGTEHLVGFDLAGGASRYILAHSSSR